MKIIFKERTHQYFNEENKQYISVSALIKRLEPKKDWDEIKRKYAKKNGMTVPEVTAKWERARILGSGAGTIYHADRERELLEAESIEYDGVNCAKQFCLMEQGNKVSIPIEKLNDNTIYPELIIYDHKYRICGQSDKVIVANKRIHILDYKTDKSIETKAFSSDWVKPEHLLEPVSHLENCNFNIYSLKMSTYMFMLWKQNKGYKVGDLILEHVPLIRDEEGIPILKDGKPLTEKTRIIKVPYLKKEVKDIFEYYAAQNS